MNDRLAGQKLELEIQALSQQLTQLTQSKKKLELEVEVLASQVGKFGSFARVFWPVISALVTIIIGTTAAIYTSKIQDDQAFQKRREVYQTYFSSAIHDATDEQKGTDTRIAGLWALGTYVGNEIDAEYSVVAANVLARGVSTGPDVEDLQVAESRQPIRLAAAEVIGTAIAGNPYQFDIRQHRRAQTVARLFYGVGQTGELGVLTRVHLYLLERRTQLSGRKLDTAAIELKLAASREAIRKNWECLEGVNLRAHDLTGILLYEAEMPHASLAGAEIKGADLHLANLFGANLDSVKNWDSARIELANIKAVQRPPAGFEMWALDHNAVAMGPDQWRLWRGSGSPMPKDWTAWRKSGFVVDANGFPR